MKTIISLAGALTFAISGFAQLPDPGFEIDANTAFVITDPQNDFLSPEGVTWGVVGQSVTENHTVENLDRLFQIADAKGMLIFISPHYYYPQDKSWKFEGALEVLMHKINMFDRVSPLSLEGFENSGADWLQQYKKYISKDNVIICSPHKVYGPQTNDLVLQLRKRGINKVILAGMSSNLCVESHLRQLLETGFEVAVVKDATAGAILPDMNAYEASLINFRMMASHVYTTDEVTAAINSLASNQ